METSHYFRRVLGLIVVFTLISGCHYAVRTKTLFGDERDQYPAVVLKPQNHSHDYEFDWDKNTVGGVRLSEWQPKQKYWRLQLFSFSSGDPVGNTGKWKAFKDNRTEKFTGLEF